ncbi:MAG: coproporphyrinogen III oxidase, partial [Luteibaculum sp.]
LSPRDIFNENIMTGLRKKEGLPVSLWLNKGENPKNILQNPQIEKLYRDQFIYLEDQNLKLTQRGRHFADGIAAQLFK